MLPNGKSANNFDVLRIAFALIVTFLHVYEVPGGDSEKLLWRPGEMAVGMFFAISGYLICQSWLRKPDLIAFLQKRVSRIYPGSIACSLICGLLIAPWISSPDF
jgi:peptidoglycan/LPS O-acetylase OafA/YrhL